MASRTPSSPPVLPGLTYVRPLGSGGFADVFLYAQDMPRREVAVKVLPAGVSDRDLLRMFNAEADVLAHLSSHPSIVTVYQAGVSADGRPYIVMENCPDSLAQRYRLERMPVDEVLAIGVRMANALEAAHQAGLIHRDVKPSNILITAFGSPVLADFGIAASLAKDASEDVLAMSVPWSAPEVVEERTSGTIATEVWSLGATVYSLLAGHSPFERREKGQNAREQLKRRISRAVYTEIARPDVPAELQEVLARAMSKDPVKRFASAREFAEALREVQRLMGFAPTPLDLPQAQWQPSIAAADLNDDMLRGPVRSHVEHESRRKPRQGASTSGRRDRGDDAQLSLSAPQRPSTGMMVGILVGAAVLVVLTVVLTLVVSGVL